LALIIKVKVAYKLVESWLLHLLGDGKLR